MTRYRKSLFATLVFILSITSISLSLRVSAVTSPSCDEKTTVCHVDYLLGLSHSLKAIVEPDIATPEWMKPITPPSKPTSSQLVTVTYNVEVRGAVIASLAEFKQQANETLNDARGWSRMNVRFIETAAPGSFTLSLASPESIGAVPGCGAEYSCRSGRNVMINDNRWQGATASWQSAGGSLRDYRHMVINHETGHWLGHDHESCSGAGQPAPVMQQQSIDLQGCAFNPWPTVSELWSTTLGIV